jgi:hypothetical protein
MMEKLGNAHVYVESLVGGTVARWWVTWYGAK